MPLSPRVPARPARVRRSLPGLTLVRLVGRIPVRVALGAVILSVLLLPVATPTFGKGAGSRVASRANLTPSASGAEAAYPLNHVLDATGGAVGTPPSNYDFEAAPTAVGAPPANSDFEAAATDAGLPANFDFAGDFTGWTTAGSPTIQTDTPHGKYAKLPAGAAITSSAFTIDAAAQVLSFDLGYLTTNNYSWVKVYVLSGPTYSTETFLGEWYCFSCGNWVTITVDPTSYRGQSVKLKFAQSFGEVGVDNVKAQVLFPSYTTGGSFSRQTETGGNTYARLDGSGALTTAAFTIDATAQVVTLRLKGLTTGADQYKVTLLSGTTFATSTQLAFTEVADSWTTLRYTVSAWAGQPVKLKVERFLGSVGVDDVGLQLIDIPNWNITGATTRLTGGPTGTYVRTDGNLTSTAFTLPAGVQQLSVGYKGDSSGAQFYLELLRGADFSQVVDLAGGTVVADQTQWKTYKAGVSAYAGESVKLRIRQYFAAGLFDTAGPMEALLPGWTLNTVDAVATGEDTNGTYATPYKSGGTVHLRTSIIQSGVIDRSAYSDMRYFAVAYDIGTQTGSLLRVTWYNTAGQNWVVQTDAANSPTGYRTKYFWVADFMGQVGYFVVQVTGGKVYSIADNIARQRLVEPFSAKVGLQIDTSTGAFGFSARDVTDRSAGLPLSLSRSYHAHSDRLGTLGYRWTHSYDTRLVVTDDGDAGIVFGDGREAFFDWIPDQVGSPAHYEAADARVKDTLTKNADGTQTLHTTTNLNYRFAADGKLLSLTDKNGNALTPAYDGQGRVTTVTGAGGATLTFAYTAQGRLSTVTDPDGGVTTYTYDAAGDLASVRNPVGGTVAYTYDRHRLTRVVDETGQTLSTNTLDSVHRVTTQTDAAGKTITLAYDTPGKGATRVTDPTGQVATYYYDAWHRTTDRVDPLGRVVSNHYDGVGNLLRIVDPANNQWQFAYDASGMLTSATDPNTFAIQATYDVKHLPTTVRDARGNVTTLEYDTAGNVIRRTDPLGGMWQYSYDSRGNLLTETNPLGQAMTSAYNSRNQRTSKQDPLGNTWTWTYSLLGNLTAETNPLGHTTTYTYDVFGRMLTRTDALNNTTTYTYNPRGLLVSVTDPLNQPTTYTYDNRHLLASRTDPAGKVWTFTYDDNRRRLTETNPLGQTTRYAYDSTGRLVSVTDPLGNVTTTTYDTAGRVASERDPLGRTTSYAYDTAGRLTSTTAPNGGLTRYTYDAGGNLLTVTDALNKVTTYEYDALSRRTKMTDPLGGITTSAYDAAGRKTSVTNPLNQTTSYTYDAAGRLLTTTDPLGRVRSSTYDAVGRVIATTDPLGNLSTTTYDALGRVTRTTRPSGAATSRTYDPRGLLLTETDPLGNLTRSAYDDAGRRLTETDPRGAVTTYAYDAAGRQTSLTDALGGVVRWTYDASGQETAVTNARGKTSTTTYDALGNPLTETDPLGRTTTHTYDLLGRPTRSTDARGIAVDHTYDAADRLTSLSYPGGSITYTFDAVGRRTGMTDASGTSAKTYDAAGRVLTNATPQGTVSYTYNAAGDRAAMTLPGARTVTYAYDTAGRLATLTDWQQRTMTFAYDVDGRQTSIGRPNGVVTTKSYDAAGRLTGLTHTRGATTLQSFTYTYDTAGNRIGANGSQGTESYTLDAVGRLTSVTYPGGATVSYSYDANGNRLTKAQGGSTSTYSYDDADQLIAEGSVTSTYDAAGNLTARGTDSFTWDWRNRLTATTVGGTTTTYTYDGDDVRVRKTASSATTYLWDRESGLPLLVDDGTNGYVHADAETAEIGAGGARRDLLGDGLGSVRGATDGAGALTGSADYDVYGTVRGTNTTSSVYGFTGEQVDAETGFLYLRARYYDPAAGRFLSADAVAPNAAGTQGWNRYAYVAGNPTTLTDPSGHQAQGSGTSSGPRRSRPGTGTAITPGLGGLINAIMTAMVAVLALETWIAVGVLAHLGALDLCARDAICGSVLVTTVLTIDLLFINPPPIVAELLDLIWEAFPIAYFAVWLVLGMGVLTAVAECFADERCKPKDECRAPVSPGPYQPRNGREDEPVENWPWYSVGPKPIHEMIEDIYRQDWESHGQYVWTHYKHPDLDIKQVPRVFVYWVVYSDVSGAPRRVKMDTDKGGDGRKDGITIDHICSVHDGGKTSHTNACVMTRSENSRKNKQSEDCPVGVVPQEIPSEWGGQVVVWD